VPAPRPSTPRPQPERLALGEASRLLGVDPDTLRRWADEGRVPAFTTPGGHRRFERRALERLIAARRTGPAGGLAGLGATPDRLSAAYRRRYGEPHTGSPNPRTTVPASERESYREIGRGLVGTLVRHLDEQGPGRALAERDAVEHAARLGERLAVHGVPLADGVSMFVSARRPFLAELSVVARRRGVDAARVGELYDASTGLLDRLLLAFVAAHEVASHELRIAEHRARGASGGDGAPGKGEDPGRSEDPGKDEDPGGTGDHAASGGTGDHAASGGAGDLGPAGTER
jgi:excisionase family DNA binding protein